MVIIFLCFIFLDALFNRLELLLTDKLMCIYHVQQESLKCIYIVQRVTLAR